ncbi:hypothetical protein [Pseudonocardia spinosispora]|uniref:hypothetical protein n=1 Tax=Pseudonocardia spinosispora TaxID=103441 RepID=UPI00041762B6|nr:hypothetical protein [Pseudonocardia spinosispora]
MFSPDPNERITTAHGVDTDHNGLADTVPLSDPDGVLLAVDTDGDQLADRIVHIGQDDSAISTAANAPWLPTGLDAHQCTDPLWDHW